MLRQHEGFLLKVCLVFGGRGREDFKDLYQEIALNLWESWKFFRGESDPGTWVVRIALNVAGDRRLRWWRSLSTAAAVPSLLGGVRGGGKKGDKSTKKAIEMLKQC